MEMSSLKTKEGQKWFRRHFPAFFTLAEHTRFLEGIFMLSSPFHFFLKWIIWELETDSGQNDSQMIFSSPIGAESI